MIMKESVSQLAFTFFSEQCLEEYDKIIYFQKTTIYISKMFIYYITSVLNLIFTNKKIYFSCLQKLP